MNINCLSKTQRLFKSNGDKSTTSLMFYGKCFMLHGWYFTGKKSPSNMKLQSYSLSVQFSHSVVSDSLWLHGLQHARSPCRSSTPRLYSNFCPSSQWCHPTTSSSVIPSPPTFSLSQHQGLFQWVSSPHQVARVLEFQLQHLSFQWTSRTDLL